MRHVPARTPGSLALALLVGAACTSAINFREANRRNLEKLTVGMDRLEVLDVMGVGEYRQFTGSETQGPLGTGTDSMGVTSVRIPVGGDTPVLYNPHRSELYEAHDGTTWEVFFYYTHVAHDDGRVTDDELTPLVLEDGLLVGWGWKHWAAQVSRNGLDAEIPDPLPDRELTTP